MCDRECWADYVKSSRRMLGWTQERAARELAVSVSTVQKWEHGVRVPTTEMRLKYRNVIRDKSWLA